MPFFPIPLFTPTYKNADGSVLTDDAFVQYNGFIDGKGGLNIRPGEILAKNSSGRRNDGLFHWPDKNFIVSIDEGYVSLNKVDTTQTEFLVEKFPAAAVTFGHGNNVTSFATDGDFVYMAAGGRINYVNSSGVIAEITDTEAPDRVTHIGFLDGYLLAINGGGNNADNKFYWSEISAAGSPRTSWLALNFASAEGNPDKNQAMLIVQRQVYLLGTVSTEIWENDGSTPFSRIPGGLIQIGCLAKYSPIIRGNSIIWLGHTRQFVEFTGTSVKFLGSQYDKELAKFGTVTDCIGSYVQHDGQEHCIFYFPTEDRTLVYDPVSENWCEWAHWDSEALEWKAYDIRSSAKDLTSGKTLVGKKAKYIAALESKSRVDMVGTRYKAFKFLRQTGWIDHGNSKRKRCEQLSFRVTRGDSAPEDNSAAAAAGSPNTGDFIDE